MICQCCKNDILDPGLYWLSFIDKSKPEGKRFLGVCIVQADTFNDAVYNSKRLRINPGGEIAGGRLKMELDRFEPHINKLLSREEIERFELA